MKEIPVSQPITDQNGKSWPEMADRYSKMTIETAGVFRPESQSRCTIGSRVEFYWSESLRHLT